VKDLRKMLAKQHGVPSGVVILGRTKEKGFIRLDNNARPRRYNVLEGVLSFGDGVKVVEADMIKAQGDLNKRFDKEDAQELLRQWKSAIGTGSQRGLLEKFRDLSKAIFSEILPVHGFAATTDGYGEWTKLQKSFQRFPNFKEIWRKGEILRGTLTPEEATSDVKRSMMRANQPDRPAPTTSKHGQLVVREISSAAALVRERKDADAVFDILYQRIYEENRQELWEGGKVKGHKMPTRKVVARKYLEPPGVTLLHCTSNNAGASWTAGSVVGGASIFQVLVNGIDNSASSWGEGEELIKVDTTASVEEVDDSGDDEEDFSDDESTQIMAGYIDACAAETRSGAGSAMLDHVEAMAEAEGWDMLVAHSIRIEKTCRFWEKKGFRHYGPGKEAGFRLACLQNNGFAISISALERQLPPRPTCLLFVKFLKGLRSS